MLQTDDQRKAAEVYAAIHALRFLDSVESMDFTSSMPGAIGDTARLSAKVFKKVLWFKRHGKLVWHRLKKLLVATNARGNSPTRALCWWLFFGGRVIFVKMMSDEQRQKIDYLKTMENLMDTMQSAILFEASILFSNVAAYLRGDERMDVCPDECRRLAAILCSEELQSAGLSAEKATTIRPFFLARLAKEDTLDDFRELGVTTYEELEKLRRTLIQAMADGGKFEQFTDGERRLFSGIFYNCAQDILAGLTGR